MTRARFAPGYSILHVLLVWSVGDFHSMAGCSFTAASTCLRSACTRLSVYGHHDHVVSPVAVVRIANTSKKSDVLDTALGSLNPTKKKTDDVLGNPFFLDAGNHEPIQSTQLSKSATDTQSTRDTSVSYQTSPSTFGLDERMVKSSVTERLEATGNFAQVSFTISSDFTKSSIASGMTTGRSAPSQLDTRCILNEEVLRLVENFVQTRKDLADAVREIPIKAKETAEYAKQSMKETKEFVVRNVKDVKANPDKSVNHANQDRPKTSTILLAKSKVESSDTKRLECVDQTMYAPRNLVELLVAGLVHQLNEAVVNLPGKFKAQIDEIQEEIEGKLDNVQKGIENAVLTTKDVGDVVREIPLKARETAEYAKQSVEETKEFVAQTVEDFKATPENSAKDTIASRKQDRPKTSTIRLDNSKVDTERLEFLEQTLNAAGKVVEAMVATPKASIPGQAHLLNEEVENLPGKVKAQIDEIQKEIEGKVDNVQKGIENAVLTTKDVADAVREIPFKAKETAEFAKQSGRESKKCVSVD